MTDLVKRPRATRALARRDGGGRRRLGGRARAPLGEPGSWGAARTFLPSTGRSARGGSEPRSAGPRSVPKRPSQPAPSSVFGQVTRELRRLRPPAQLADVLVLPHRLAIDGILESLELRLQMIHP